MTACASSPGSVDANLETNLPDAPEYMAPIEEKPLYLNQNAKAALAQCIVDRRVLNRRLTASAGWYGDLRNNYGRRK